MKLAVLIEDHIKSRYHKVPVPVNTVVLMQGQGGGKENANVQAFPNCFKPGMWADSFLIPRKKLRFLTSEERQLARMLFL